jgi:nicotinate-nucleotide pyrophosphorylase (carboxylating)
MNSQLLKELLLAFVKEDVYFEDITSKFTPSKTVKAAILIKEPGVISGIEELGVLFRLFNIRVLNSFRDGVVVPNSLQVMLIKGNTHDILLIERTALNLLSRMSGIATLTKKYIEKAKHINPAIRIAATRKTTPGFRYFEKRAVEVAGGDTHRMGLSDMILIKDNHLKLLKDVPSALKKAKEQATFAHKIEVEVTSSKDALLAARQGADLILLDNMNPNKIKKVIESLEKNGLRSKVLLEASGGITLGNVEEYAETGVDIISSGQLTSSYNSLDVSLEIL